MTITYCDLCGGEIKLGTCSGGVMRLKDIHQILPVLPPPGIEKEGAMIQKKRDQEIWDLCQECQKWIWEQAEIRQKDLQKAQELLKKES